MTKSTGPLGRVLEKLSGAEQLDPAQQGPTMQGVSSSYWRNSTDTYLGSGEYYDRRAAALDRWLSDNGKWRRAVDLGCGDGRYTIQVASHADVVEGSDIGPSLIESARARAEAAGTTNARFYVAEAQDLDQAAAYDLALALGVTSCFVDEGVMTQFLQAVHRATRPGADLLTVDSLSKRGDSLSRFESGYVARYRPRDAYVAAFEAAGFTLVSETDLGTPAVNPILRALPIGRRINHMFHFRRDGR